MAWIDGMSWLLTTRYATLPERQIKDSHNEILYITPKRCRGRIHANIYFLVHWSFLGGKVTTPADSSCVKEEITYWLDTPFTGYITFALQLLQLALFKRVNKQSDLTFDSHKSPFPCLLTHTNAVVLCSPHWDAARFGHGELEVQLQPLCNNVIIVYRIENEGARGDLHRLKMAKLKIV